MTQETLCFLLEPSEVAEVSLRRFTYVNGTPCTTWGHNATVALGQVEYPLSNDLEGDSTILVDRTDPRWPIACEHCGYSFLDTDEWQRNNHRMYRRADGTGGLTVLGQAPVGSMWYASWLKGLQGFRSPDGNILIVRTPGGDWVVDGPSTNGGGWTRTGIAPNVSVTPSIVIGSYHGFLTGGVLRSV